MAHDIDQAAADWLARSDSGRMTPEEQAALETWLRQDRRHAGAYARARAILAWSARTAAVSPAASSAATGAREITVRPRVRDRRARRAAIAAAALVALALGSFAYLRVQSQERYATLQGEVRRLNLRDGSTLTLNTASSARVMWSDEARRVQLLEGEALFEVAPDSTRPFIVESGTTTVRAVGTSFSVRRMDGGEVEIVVREGEVAVESLDATAADAIALGANMRAVDQPGQAPRSERWNDDQVAQHLSWRDGMIAFDGDTLAEAAREFARYSPRPLRIEDAQVSEMRIVGLFASNDPAGFARAAALSLGLEAEIDEDGIRLRHRRDHR